MNKALHALVLYNVLGTISVGIIWIPSDMANINMTIFAIASGTSKN